MPQWGRALPILALQPVSSGGEVSKWGKHKNPAVFLLSSPRSCSALTAITMGILEHPHPSRHLFVGLLSMNSLEPSDCPISTASCGSKFQLVTTCWLKTGLLVF